MTSREQALYLLAGKFPSGPVFFQTAAEALAAGTGCRWAGIGELGDDGSSVSLLALWDGDHQAEPFCFELAGSPCLQVYQSDPDNPHAFFPCALAVTYNGITTPLEHWHYDVFNGTETDDPTFEDMRFQFRSDVDGNVAAVEAPFEVTLGPIVFDKTSDPRLSDPEYLARFTGSFDLPGRAGDLVPGTSRKRWWSSSATIRTSAWPSFAHSATASRTSDDRHFGEHETTMTSTRSGSSWSFQTIRARALRS